jgi:hypothetical protein
MFAALTQEARNADTSALFRIWTLEDAAPLGRASRTLRLARLTRSQARQRHQIVEPAREYRQAPLVVARYA